MDRFWKEALGLGALCVLVGVLVNAGNDSAPIGPALSAVGGVLIAAGLLMWWVRAQVSYRRQKREGPSSRP